MPLPVERSQGSVSDLVARFQTAAAHNAATAQREASRRSSSSSATSGNGEDRPRVVSAGGWRKAGEGSGIGEAAGKGQVKGDEGSGTDKVEEKVEVLKESEKAQDGDQRLENKDKPGSVLGKDGKPASSVPKNEINPNGTLKNGPSSPKTSKAPAPIATAPSDSPAKKNPQSPTAPKTASPRTRTRVASNTSSVPSPRTATGKTGTEGEKAGPRGAGKEVKSSHLAGKDDKEGTSQVGAGTTAVSSSAGTASKIPRSRSSLPPNTSRPTPTASTSQTVESTDRAVGKTTATPRSTTGPSQPSDKTTSTSTPTPAAGKRPPSTFKPTKSLTPSMTGPSPSRRPISSIGQSPVPTPLRPQVTGTPSKPTASSLAKARNTPLPDSPSTSTLSLGRASSKRMSMGPIPSRQTRAGTESPLKAQETGEGLRQKTRISGSSSMSRLLQGTAASRAKAVDGLPGSAAGSPAQAKKTAAKGGVSKSVSAKSLTGAPKSPTPTKTAGSSAKIEEPISAKIASPVPSESTDGEQGQKQRDQPITPDEQPEKQQSPSISDQEHKSSSIDREPDGAQAKSSEASIESKAPLPGLTEPVGDSPIGRIGLPAVHVPDATPTAPDDIGQNPVIAATPSDTVEDTQLRDDEKAAGTGNAESD